MERIEHSQLGEILYREELPNGLQVYVLPKPGFFKTYATFTTHYGSIDNHFRPPGKEAIRVPDGIAHFLEHKMFEEEDGDVFQRFAAQGASANAFTSFDRTAYLFSSTDRVEENLTTLIDFVQNPYFTEEGVEKEKGIIGQEIRMYDDNPDWRAYFGLIESLYQRHPVRIDIAGTVESISRITKDALYTCYETFYHPGNMLLFVVGPVDPEKILDLVKENQAKKTFAPPGEIERFFPEEPEEVARRRHEIRLSVGVSKCLFGFKEPRVGLTGDDYLNQETATYVVLEALFGPGSDLYQSLYDDGLIDENFSFDYSLERGYGFSVIGGDTPDPDALIKRVEEEIPRVLDKGIPEEVVHRIRKKRLGQMLRALNSPEWIANQFTRYRFNQSDLFRVVPVLEKLTPEEVNRRLREHVDPDRMAVSMVKPLGQ
ncbi:Predicted Zn-dependent peptidase [Planifilum fulgidum]|jgi:predicted Zn-dependent peptidase|uniref:Predicted Zn-dependent peptidase n=1 Tax=Planifilum fulgidum TaxID=201973 RepID=A0A1I2RT14_9BACL|nr:pitrilysin family protein [Planifilum fulgidum]MBO2532197.1 insulinase family protein [Thermoactinomycetaceae bacterium]SFG43835.1 Predicted Zn-dependent peptidase [Planifilum fulgidum]